VSAERNPAPLSRGFAATRAFWRAWWQVILLGVLTVGSYGLGVYAYGVMIGPIHEATGWSVGSLSAAFTFSSLIGGFGGAAGGWLLDRYGGRPVLLGSLLVGSGFLLLSASAGTLPVFIVTWGIGGGVISAGLFYNVTMALTTRLFPGNRVRAFSILTFVGGFAAVLYFPLAGLLVDTLEWRLALRIMVLLLALHVLPAALLISGGAAVTTDHDQHAAGRGDFGGVLEAFRSRDVVQMIAMFALANMAFAAISVHQVPAMTAVGVSLGGATAIASVRGFLSLPGRAFMEPVTRRLGVPGATGLAYVFMVAGMLPLAIGGGAVWLFIFTVLTGLAFGTISPLHGLYAAEVYGIRRIGTLMGVQSLIVSVFAATGPSLIGLTVDATGGYRVAIVLMCALFGAALLLLLARPRPSAPPPAIVVVEG
jgi:MFS family permease